MLKTNDSVRNESGSRLPEMTAILRKYKIMQGINPEKLRQILEELGPTYIKLGQIMALHSDILPKSYCEELMKLNSNVPPMPFHMVEEVLEEAYGCRSQEIFSFIEEKTLGSASIAQVHRAKLKTGENVIIKVQRKGIHDTMSRDIGLLKHAARLIMPVAGVATGLKDLVDPQMVLDELWQTAQEEMDFLTEASNMEEFCRNNAGVAYAGCPKLFKEYTTSHVLVMEYIDGLSIDDVDGLKENGYDLDEVGRKFINHFIKQVMDDGFFHADPHPGNVKIHDGKIIWIDMGMMGRLSEKDRKIMGEGVRSVARHDVQGIVNAVLGFGSYRGTPDREQLYHDVRQFLDDYDTVSMGGVNLPEILGELMEIMKKNHISMPHGMTMLARGLAHMEGVLSVISPELNMVDIAISRFMEDYLQQIDWKKELEKNGKKLYRAVSKGADIPSLTADVLNDFVKGRTEVNLNLKASLEFRMLIDRAVRNTVIGLCVAALLISSSVICMTDMNPKILHIPVLGFVGYVVALLIAVFFTLRYFARKLKYKKL